MRVLSLSQIPHAVVIQSNRRSSSIDDDKARYLFWLQIAAAEIKNAVLAVVSESLR